LQSTANQNKRLILPLLGFKPVTFSTLAHPDHFANDEDDDGDDNDDDDDDNDKIESLT
jgi:hypothetical protein